MSISGATQPTGLGQSASDLPVARMPQEAVSNPRSVPPTPYCSEIVARVLAPVLTLPESFKHTDDRRKFDRLVVELRAHAENIDCALGRLDSSGILPVCKGEALTFLDAVRNSVYTYEVSDFGILARWKGDTLGVHWKGSDISMRPARAYDDTAVRAGSAIGEAYDAIKAFVLDRVREYRNSQPNRVVVFPSDLLVGPVELDPVVLLERVPTTLHGHVKNLMQGVTTPTSEHSARCIEESSDRHCPAVFAALRYATLQGHSAPLVAMARAFPEYRSDTLAFAMMLHGTISVSDAFKCGVRSAIAYAHPESIMPNAASSEIAQRLSHFEKEEVMRFWLADPDRCDALTAPQREHFTAEVSKSILAHDVSLVRAVASRYPEFWKCAASQAALLRASEPHPLSVALSRLTVLVREHMPFRASRN